jgi:glycosyltransferase involved in cell wall biosynthesis
LQDPARAEAMGLAARNRYESMFTARQMASAYLSAYQDVLAARR